MSRFKPLADFTTSASSGYKLLPFDFTLLSESKYVVTNMAGEFIVLERSVLESLVGHTLASDTQAYADLKASHFLLDEDSNVAVDLLALKVRSKQSRIANFTGLHIFVATLRCEHSCPYCQVSRQNDDKRAFDMSLETADKALEMVFRSPSPTIKIEFQGGEPFLNFSLIQYVVERAERINAVEQRDIEFVVATNLAIVTDEMLDYCRVHGILISTSLDGPADLHNANRPRPGNDSHERAISGIRRARGILGRAQVGALMTTTSASLTRVREIIDEYVRMEFGGVFLRPLSPYGFAIKTKSYDAYDMSRWLDFYFEGLDYIIDLNRQGLPFEETYASIILTKMLTPFDSGYVDLRSPAGIGIGALIYNYDGAVYASDESRMLAEMRDTFFRLGDVHVNSWSDIMTSQALLEPLEASFAKSAPMCSECAFEPYCGADPVFHHATQGNVVGHKPTSGFCARNMAIMRGLIERMHRDEETAKIFSSWVRP